MCLAAGESCPGIRVDEHAKEIGLACQWTDSDSHAVWILESGCLWKAPTSNLIKITLSPQMKSTANISCGVKILH